MNLTKSQAENELEQRTYYETLPGGEIIAYDMLTGKKIGHSRGLQELMGGDTTRWSYHQSIVDKMCDVMVDMNLTLAEICKRPEFPNLSTIMRWKRVFPEVQKRLDEALSIQAEGYYHRIVENVEVSGMNRDELAEEKLRFEKLKYLAGVANPYKYGNRTIHSGDAVAPVQFIISTGINRDNNQGGDNDEGKSVEREERVGAIGYDGED